MIFQVAYSCPHNTCLFCGMYKGVPYTQRSEQEILQEIEETGKRFPNEKRFFLADGDVMNLPYELLHKILSKINDSFAKVARINVYANGSSILDKTAEELCELRKLKLNTVYLGLETGSQELLDLVHKKESVNDMIKAVKFAENCGIRSSVMILLGLGGENYSAKHAKETALALNKMQPRLLSALRFIEVPRTKMFDSYIPISEQSVIDELYKIIKNLDLKRTVFRANHTSNPVPLRGRFPQDKDKLLFDLQQILNSNILDANGFGDVPLYL